MYLRTDPEVVHKRILQRARKEEKTVPLSYIEALHDIHENWYVFVYYLIYFILCSLPYCTKLTIWHGHSYRLHHKKSFPVPAKVIGN